MPSGIDDLSPAATPTMISAQQVSQLDQYRFLVEVEWEDNENRDDELNTIFTYKHTDGSPGGSASVYVGDGTGYTAAGTGRCKGTVIMSEGEFNVTAKCCRNVTISDIGGGVSSKVSIKSEDSNAVPCTVAPGATPQKPGKGQGGGKGHNK